MVRVAINGFGRIGRVALRVMLQRKDIQVVAINDLADVMTMAHLFKYDSIHGRFMGLVEAGKDELVIEGQHIKAFSEKDIAKLPWKELGVDVVIEATGKFTSKEDAQKHISSGAKRVIISAPAKHNEVPTIVLGVNNQLITAADTVISNASCTTNNVAPMMKVLDDHWGIEFAYVTTVHSFTSDQNLHDAPHRDLRRARAATQSIIPTTTGAAKAIASIFPHLEGKIGGAGIRVPVPDGSLTDLTCTLRITPTVKEINDAFKKASETYLKGIMEYTSDPIVSVDVLGNTHSCLFDSELTSVVGGMVKVVGWYDNEVGYANRLADLVKKLF